jgi:hypothetical protein
VTKIAVRICLLLCLALVCGCESEREQGQRKTAVLLAQGLAMLGECNGKYATGVRSVAVIRAQCHNNALSVMHPIYPFPDLLDSYAADRLGLAEKYQSGQMSLVQANNGLNASRSQMVAEEQRRLTVNRSVRAEEAAEAVGTMPQGHALARKLALRSVAFKNQMAF